MPLFLFTCHVLLVMLVFPVWWICATGLALATGPEVLLKVPAYVVDCEPLPKTSQPENCTLIVDWAAGDRHRDGSLRHAIYEEPSVQRRMTDWIAQAATERQRVPQPHQTE